MGQAISDARGKDARMADPAKFNLSYEPTAAVLHSPSLEADVEPLCKSIELAEEFRVG